MFKWFKRNKKQNFIDQAEQLRVEAELDKLIKEEKRCLLIFESIVGDSPIKEIDWINNNGFKEYCKHYEAYNNRTIVSLEEQKRIEEKRINQIKINQALEKARMRQERDRKREDLQNRVNSVLDRYKRMIDNDTLIDYLKKDYKARFRMETKKNVDTQLIRGGMGNSKLMSWDYGYSYSKTYKDLDTNETITEDEFHKFIKGCRVKWCGNGVIEVYEHKKEEKPEIKTFGDMIKRIESEEFLPKDMHISYDDIVNFHNASNRTINTNGRGTTTIRK